MRIAALLHAALGVLLATSHAFAQGSKLRSSDETGYLIVRRDHGHWPSPESIASDLRSSNDEIRLKALYLLGLTDGQAHEVLWSQTSPTKKIGKKVVIPDQIQLTYAALGEDTTQQAILAIQISALQITFAALAIPAASGWERLATFDCWCKYEMYTGSDALTEFVQLHPAPEREPAILPHYELILRGSGGGTGTYVQDEAHFRMHGGELRLVMSFVSRSRSCDPTGPSPHWCTIERRWFYAAQVANRPGGVLVARYGRIAADNNLAVQWSVRDTESSDLIRLTCNSFRWNEQRFRYEQLTEAPDTCVDPGP